MNCNKETNIKSCTCTYSPCSRKGLCCECIAYHRAMNQLPACYFSEKTERSYDRSIAAFSKDQGR